MASPKVSSFKLLHADHLRELAGCSGLCLTAILPPFVPGEKTRRSPAALLRDYAHQAESTLAGLGASQAHIAALLEPLERLASDPATAEGFHWSRVILRSPEVFEEFVLRQTTQEGVTVAEWFDLLPLIAEADLPAEFYVLKLSKKQAILERAGLSLELVRLPKTAQTLDEFLELDTPDHDRENRMIAGGSRQIRFGTGHERETRHGHLHDFYKHIDQKLSAFVRPKNGMVMLVGVEEDTALYRSASTYPNLIAESIERSPDDGMPDHELLRRGLDMIRTATLQRNAAARQLARAQLAPARYSEVPDTIRELASQGRVARLYVAETPREPLWIDALIETLRHSGEAHAVPAGEPAGAVLRY
jgi:hypothetical protein